MITIEIQTREKIKCNIPLCFDEACSFYYGYIICGIYKISNITNGHCCVGQSIDIRKRWIAHKNSSLDYPLYKAFKKYGIENFVFEILEECKKQELDEKEEYYIKTFDSYNNGYNQTLLCKGSGHPNIFTQDKLYDLFDDLMYTNISKNELANKYNCSERTIRNINSGRSWRRNDIKYPIRKSWTIKEHNYCVICGKLIATKNAAMCLECMHKSQRRVIDRPSKFELAKIIIENGFSETGRRFNVSGSTIKKWCKYYEIPHKIKELNEWYLKQEERCQYEQIQ